MLKTEQFQEEILSRTAFKNIRIIGEIEDPSELENVVVKREDGNIFLRDIAEIRFQERDATTFAREYGDPVVMLDIKTGRKKYDRGGRGN